MKSYDMNLEEAKNIVKKLSVKQRRNPNYQQRKAMLLKYSNYVIERAKKTYPNKINNGEIYEH